MSRRKLRERWRRDLEGEVSKLAQAWRQRNGLPGDHRAAFRDPRTQAEFDAALDSIDPGRNVIAHTQKNTATFAAKMLAETLGVGDVYDPAEKAAIGAYEGARELKHGFRVKLYGDWGGPGWSAGRYVERDEALDPESLKKVPTDPLDRRFYFHDLRYARAGTLPTEKEREDALREADRVFIREAKKDIREGKYDITQQLAAEVAINGFRIKLATDLGYKDYAPPLEKSPEDNAKWRRYYESLLGTYVPTDEEIGLAVERSPEFTGTLASQEDSGALGGLGGGQDYVDPWGNSTDFNAVAQPARPSERLTRDMERQILEEFLEVTRQLTEDAEDDD